MRKNKFIKRKQDSMKTTILLLIIVIGLGYAILQSNLSINGTSSIDNPTWDVHWENVQVASGSVTGSNVVTAPTIDSARTTVAYSVILPTPGTYYEFTVDAVNSGTLDAMVESIDSKLNGSTITTLPEYLSYTVTYFDGTPLVVNHELKASTQEKYKVKIKYRDDITLSQIPSTDQTLSLQFTVKYKQASDDAIEINHPYLYKILRNAATEGTYAKEYTGNHQDSMAGVGTEKIYYWYGSNDTNGTAILDMNNVIFAGFCWQMIRTTDTGGVKIVYNGVPSNGQCNNSGTDTSIGTLAFNANYNSLAYVGYMYNPNTLITYKVNSAATSGSLFGAGVTYSSGTYTLTNTSTTYDANHHYTCNNTTGTCSTVRYYYYNNFYTEISDGRTIEEAIEDMLRADNVNQTNSTIKTAIDNWYQTNMTNYTSKLEDTIFCNDRSISNLGGWNPNGGSTSTTLQFKNYSSNSDLSCTNTTDKFSLANTKAKLTYPVGLLTYPETYLLNNDNVRKTGQTYWLGSPNNFGGDSSYERYVLTSGNNNNNIVSNSNGIRPAVSLAKNTIYTSGSGSKSDPYIIG